jgi:hypothetical protein
LHSFAALLPAAVRVSDLIFVPDFFLKPDGRLPMKPKGAGDTAQNRSQSGEDQSVYKIEEGRHGFTLTFGGTMYSEELSRWLDESKQALARRKGSFGVIVDMRQLLPLGPEARAIILQGQGLFRDAGLVRSAVILKSAATTMQFRQLAKDSGVYRNERYIDASKDVDCLKHALDWVYSQVDPEQGQGRRDP